MRRVEARALLLISAAASALTACAGAPAYAPPAVAAPAAFKETGPWTPAAPADDQPRGDWWTIYGDPVLNELEARAAKANPGLAAAAAAHDQALALAGLARAGHLPSIDGGALAS
ncbi:MAG: RND transporter, partial [Caulobacter sp.]